VNRVERQFVERVGRSCERDGLPRIAGQIFGLLLLSAEPRSLGDIAATLRVSKGSVSMGARRLLQYGVLEREVRPGDRRDYYQVAPDFFARYYEYRISRWTALHDVVAEARTQLPNLPDIVGDRLRYLESVQDFLLQRSDRTLAEWYAHIEARRQQRVTRTRDRVSSGPTA
jgi:predicted transcriptional regulator